MNKNKYYVNIGTREISINKDGNNDEFIVNATEDEIITLRELFDEIEMADNRSFWRAHVPFKPYHQDDDNDDFDASMKEAFQKIYDWGEEETKAQITQMNVLDL
ncbi:hydrolase [Halobacillus litoralis]|uniref:hydrolase n=1 Tax=Halobacillus litoralis TaxID=45668 RepID=UPI001CD69300|nr:hydrolase [Halobacillus litoralis]MCA0972839.1 hydrolase [Halobacillus litoralis]